MTCTVRRATRLEGLGRRFNVSPHTPENRSGDRAVPNHAITRAVEDTFAPYVCSSTDMHAAHSSMQTDMGGERSAMPYHATIGFRDTLYV